MLLYCRTDCCENLDFFLSLSKSTCNSIWSGINTVAQILCREWCIHLYLKKKSWETILVVEEPMTQHIVFNILGALKAVSILDQYSFPFSVLSIIAEQRLCILVLASCCLLYVGIYSLVFFLQHLSVNEQSLQRAGFLHPAVLNSAQYTVLSTLLAGCGYQNIISWHNYLQYFWGIE